MKNTDIVTESCSLEIAAPRFYKILRDTKRFIKTLQKYLWKISFLIKIVNIQRAILLKVELL